jgi:hypothetical protein
VILPSMILTGGNARSLMGVGPAHPFNRMSAAAIVIVTKIFIPSPLIVK